MRIEINGLQKSYKGRVVLQIPQLQLEKGKIIALLGPNGSGKTTLLRILAGLERPDVGQVWYNGEKECNGKEVSLLPQHPYLFDQTVQENVRLGLKKGFDTNKVVQEILDKVGMLSFMESNMRTLSGGEAQRVAIARTLVLKRKLILLDEPAASIDLASIHKVEELIQYVNQEHQSMVIFSTHNPSQALRLAHKVILLWEGTILEQGDPAEVLRHPKRRETIEYLGNWRID